MSQTRNNPANYSGPRPDPGVAGIEPHLHGPSVPPTTQPKQSGPPLVEKNLYETAQASDADPNAPPASGEYVQGTSEEEQAPMQRTPAGPGSERSASLGLSGVIVSSSTKRYDYEHDLQLRDTLMRRLQWRQQQYAHFGMDAKPEIVIDIQDIERDLRKLDERIAQYSHDITTREDRERILSIEQQRAAVLALARITGVPPDKIKLVDIMIGSVALVVDMPLAGAARLVAMQQVNHPMLRAQGFAHVAVDRVVDAAGAPLDRQFARAVRLAQSELMSSAPPSAEPSPYADVDATARLRVTLADTSALRPG